MEPRTFIFGAKAAPGYYLAKCIIKFINSLAEKINNDPRIDNKIKVVFIENYDVSKAELIIPAADVSEQISTTTKEASGTGNMKLMMNGAITLATLDGANVEIAEAVGTENIYIFGQSSNQVICRYAEGSYCAREWYEGDANIKRAIDFITGKEMTAMGWTDDLTRLKNELIYKDWFQTFPDFNAYVVRKNQAVEDYAVNPKNWAKRTLINIAMAGQFSSDRTIAEYNHEIWNLD